MNIEKLRNHCLSVKNAEECTPFGEDVMVYKIMGKMFVFFPLNPKDGVHFAVMKCAPEKTVELREKFAGITKGYYAGNNLKWNSVYSVCQKTQFFSKKSIPDLPPAR